MRVNGRPVPFDPRDPQLAATRLLDVLRDRLGLTGSKEGCGVGECGACAVLIDGRSACSCLVLTGQVAGNEITTVEGLADRGHGDLQAAFVRHHAVQCGYCIPGVLTSCAALLERNATPQRDDVTTALGGNLCRCTGYQRFTDAVCDVAAARRGAAPADDGDGDGDGPVGAVGSANSDGQRAGGS
ncbi:(2Fe-2S)-binding protein [Nakamurella lactea]|uniref:(2Fe-2S)-binding protein n=1 Tax=Nakamurella lactea TaxID=459515 RepID=UPI00040A83D1|nr:(2Fe-2S)-binding protein [Nakamurella lactea]